MISRGVSGAVVGALAEANAEHRWIETRSGRF